MRREGSMNFLSLAGQFNTYCASHRTVAANLLSNSNITEDEEEEISCDDVSEYCECSSSSSSVMVVDEAASPNTPKLTTSLKRSFDECDEEDPVERGR